MSAEDDELARTATAAGAPAPPLSPTGTTLGRYRIERELGVGGMGAVHAAFDPDLERRVALKVLRSAASDDESRQRLLREARAMAKLAHPNVVGVHEVGSASGRDYVAMELIDGSTIEDWLRSAPRTSTQIIDAFIAAGRGLAAAHAAGLVHRDFKPRNVLRGHDGRVVVTDFGLARGVETPAEPAAAARDLRDGEATGSLSGITRTGSVLGTPAYMAPEQWAGQVGPASDQFAFCVALWEALAGQRPFRGATIGALRDEVARGPSAAELSRLPRRARAALRRGLDPDASRRWPTMDALLAELAAGAPQPSRRLGWVAIGAAVLAAAAIGFAVTRGGGDAPMGFECPAPALDPAVVWPPGAGAQLTAAGQGPAAQQIAADVERWTAARATACSAGEAGYERRACLDGVLGRLDVVARGMAGVHAAQHADAGAYLIDPAVCAGSAVPHLVAPTAAVADVLGYELRAGVDPAPANEDALHALAAKVATDPCASALANEALAEETQLDRAASSTRASMFAATCGDDRVHADVALGQARTVVEDIIGGGDAHTKLQIAEATVARVGQADLVGTLEAIRGAMALRRQDRGEAARRYEAAAAAYARRGRVAAQIDMQLQALRLRLASASDRDYAARKVELRALRERARSELGAGDDTTRAVDVALAEIAFQEGHEAEADAALEALRRVVPQKHPRRVTGHVVDEHGAPVAGAHVYAGTFVGDSQVAAVASPDATDTRTTVSDDAGAFTFEDAPADGYVVAQAGALRAWGVDLADTVTVVLRPTTRIEGHVDLHGLAARDAGVRVGVPPKTYALVASVAPDGAFHVDGVPRGVDVRIGAAVSTDRGTLLSAKLVKTTAPVVRDVQLELQPSARSVAVIVRSAVQSATDSAQVLIVEGKQPSQESVMTFRRTARVKGSQFAQPIEGERAPPDVLAHAHRGDLYATMSNIGAAESSACAIALPNEADDKLQSQIEKNLDRLQLSCVPIPPTADLVQIDVQPWPRLD